MAQISHTHCSVPSKAMLRKSCYCLPFQIILLCNQKFKAYQLGDLSIFNIILVIKIVIPFANLSMFRKAVNMDLNVQLVPYVLKVAIVYVHSKWVVMENGPMCGQKMND